MGNGTFFPLISQHAAAIGFCDILRGNGMIEAIDDADGLGAFVGDDLCGAEEGVGMALRQASCLALRTKRRTMPPVSLWER